jgi:glycosyltransferase involved in cell wall biosynthesis
MGLGAVVTATAIEVVLPTYNGAPYLEAQLASIHAQTLRPERVLLRDDGSSDGTPQLITQLQQRYGAWLQVLPADGNLGCTANVNRLLQATSAPYVALADQDDLWLPHKLEVCLALVQLLEQRHCVDTPLLVHSDLQLADAQGRPLPRRYWQTQGLDPSRTAVRDLLITNVVTGCSALLNRSLLRHALPIPEQALMHDWWLALIAAAHGEIGAVPEPTLLYRQHARNVLGATGLGWGYWRSRLWHWRRGWQLLGRLCCQEQALGQYVELPRHGLCELLAAPRCRRFRMRPWPRKHGVLRTLGLYILLLLAP